MVKAFRGKCHIYTVGFGVDFLSTLCVLFPLCWRHTAELLMCVHVFRGNRGSVMRQIMYSKNNTLKKLHFPHKTLKSPV